MSRSSASAGSHASPPWRGRGRSSAASATPTAAGKSSTKSARGRSISSWDARPGWARHSSHRSTGQAPPSSISSITSTMLITTTSRMRPGPRPLRPTFTGGDRWRRSSYWIWNKPRWAGHPPTGSVICFQPSIATSFSSCMMASTRGGSLARRGMPSVAARGRSPAGLFPTKHESSASSRDRSTVCAGLTGFWPSRTG